jgi:hypothetical protein
MFKGQEVEGDSGRLSRNVCTYQFALRNIPKDEDIIYTTCLNKTTVNRPEFIRRFLGPVEVECWQ